jgi:hypothetical protein
MLQTVSQVPGTGVEPVAIAQQIFDLMGIDSVGLKAKGQAAQQMPQMTAPQQTQLPSAQGVTSRANVPALTNQL